MTWGFIVTFGTPAVQLSTALAALAGTGANVPSAVRWLSLQPDGSNSNPTYIGGNNTAVNTSSSNAGFRLEKATSTVPPAPWVMEMSVAAIDLSEFWIIGTSGEKLWIFCKT